MATDLTGLQVRNTYNSLLKIGDNSNLTGTAKRISDGLGNDSPLFISTSQISIGVAPATGYDLTVNSGIRTGSIDVLGAATAQSLQFTGGSGTQATMSWNTDEETVDLIQNGATLQLGQETHVHVKNQSGATINDGTPVYVTGTLGASGRLTVAPMIADGSIPAKYFLGVTTEDIPNGEDGKVTTFGKIRGLDTTAYTEGQTLYVSSTTAGFWQTTPPAAPALDLEVAIVINVSANNGTLFVRSTNGQYLGMLHDVYLNSVANNQLLVYNSTNSRWENQGIASIGSINLDTVTDNGNTTTNSISVGDINAGNVTLTGYLRGAANFVIDPAAHGDETGVVQILGDLRVDGTTTTINSTTVTINDKNIVLAEGSALPGDANGAGITIDGAGASMTYNSTSDRFVFNKDIETNLVGNVTGNLTGNADTASALETARNIAVDGAVTGNADFDGSANITITTTVNHNHDDRYYTETESDNRFVNVDGDTMTGDLHFNDDVKAKFGTGDDLTVYHNATNSLIDNATGSILIRNLADDQDIVLASDDGAGSITDYLRVDGSEGSVKLFHYGSQKLVTTATGVSVTGAFSGNLDTSSISGSTIDINGTTRINLQYNGTTQAFVDSTGFNISGGLALTGVDGISLTDEDSTTDSYFHANVDYDGGLYTVTSNTRYGSDYIQVDGLDSRDNVRFAISPKDIGDPDPHAYLYIGGDNSITAPNTLVDWHTIYMNALSVRINNNEVATQSWVNTTLGAFDLQDVTDNGNSTDNSIIISNAVPLYFTSTGTGTYNKGVLYSNTTDGFTFEAPWETDAATTRVPFILTWRGGIGNGGIKLNGDTQLHTNNSGLGVDITSPSAKLHVGGTSIFDGLMTVNDGNNYAKLGDLNSNSTMVLELKDGLNPIQLEAYGDNFRVYTGGSHRFTIDSGGDSYIESTNRLYFNNTNAGIWGDGQDLRLFANDDFYIDAPYIRAFNASTEYWRFDQASGATGYSWINVGYLGIGKAAPDDKLDVNGIIRSSSSSAGDYVRLYGGSGTGQWDIYGNGENLRFSENSGGGGCVTIDDKLGIGTSGFGSTAAKFLVGGYLSNGSSAVAQLNGFVRIKQELIIHDASDISKEAHLVYDGTNGLYFTPTNGSGNFGIGTTTPDAKLHVTGKASYTTANSSEVSGLGFIRLQPTSDSEHSLWIHNAANNLGISGYSDAATTSFRDITLQTYGGNVAIGNDSATAKLHIKVDSANDDTFHIWNGGVRTHLLASESTNGVIYMRNSANTNTVRINASGQSYFNGGALGIGTTNPIGGKLHVQSSTGVFESPTSGSSVIDGNTHAIIVGPTRNRTATANTYYGGVAFSHLLNYNGGTSYNPHPQAWIGLRLYDTPGSERSNLVFATKQGTGTTASDVPIERMTIDPFGNVGIGTGSPSNTLHVAGSTFLSDDVYVGDGSNHLLFTTYSTVGGAYSGSFGWNSLQLGNNGGNYILAGNNATGGQLGIYTNVTSRYRYGVEDVVGTLAAWFDASGNVGINTSTPSEKLQVVGSAQFGESSEVSGSAPVQIRSGIDDVIHIVRSGIRTWKHQVDSSGTYVIRDDDGSFNAISISTSGNIGMGVNPESTSRLHIKDTTKDAKVTIETADAYDSFINFSAASSEFSIGYDRTDNAFKVCSGNNITSTPHLLVKSNGAVQAPYVILGRPAGSDNTIEFVNGQNSSTYIGGHINYHGSGNLSICSGGGSVGIGVTSPDAKLHVNGGIKVNNPSTSGGTNTNQVLYVPHPSLSAEYFTMGFKDTARSGEVMQHPSGPYAGTSAFYIECGSTEAGGICLDQDSVHVYGSSDGGATFRVIDKDADVVTFEMLQTSWNGVFRGDVIAYGSMSSISDKRIKENIEPYENVLDKLCSLGVYSYNKITLPEHKRNRKEIGVIAQEVEAVFPELVNEEKVDKPQDANGLEQIKTVDYEHLTAILLQSIKELRNEVNELKARLDD